MKKAGCYQHSRHHLRDIVLKILFHITFVTETYQRHMSELLGDLAILEIIINNILIYFKMMDSTKSSQNK